MSDSNVGSWLLKLSTTPLPPPPARKRNQNQSRALSVYEKLRVHARGTPDENDELVRTSLVQECRRSKAVVIKETRVAEVNPMHHQ